MRVGKPRGTRSAAIVASVLAAVAFALAGGCGDASSESAVQERRAERPSRAPQSPPTAVPPVRREGSGDQQLFSPLRPPLAYFGELDLDRIVEPVAIEPIERGSMLLIVVDTLNVRHLGMYGYERDTSPNLDRLAARGVAFTNYISNSSWTRPSFTTILTGLPKSAHRVELDSGRPLAHSITTAAERFLRAGYRTAGFVGNPMMLDKWGFGQGYQIYEDTDSIGRGYFPRDEVLVDKALRWLERIGDQPFFAMLFLTAPHPPYASPGGYRRFLSSVPPGRVIRHPFKEYQEPLPVDDHARIVAAYDDEIAYSDAQIGRLVQYLARTGKLARTAIVVTADHGEVFGQHNCYLHAYHMWDQTLRVPLIVVAPGMPVRGAYDDRPFTHIDLAPTLLDLVDLDYPPDELPGRSICDALEDPTGDRKRVLFSQYNTHGVRRQAIRNGRWKLVHHHQVERRAIKDLDRLHPAVAQPDPRDLPTLAWDGERYEFYDLAHDPDENRDLFSTHRDRPELLELVGALEPHLGEEAEQGELSADLVEALEALGYLQVAPDDAQRPEGE